MTWDDLAFWNSKEWQTLQERLDAQEQSINPNRHLLFASIDSVDFNDVKVVVLGQDPYPNPVLATGIAFSIPEEYSNKFPPSLSNILKEYSDDLHLPTPVCGDLTRWCGQGVLLWNVIPTCETWKPLSHYDWVEWRTLTQEIIETLSKRCIVFAFLGGVAREFTKFVNTQDSDVIETSHPSPRGNINSKNPFLGSRIFTTINTKLVERGIPPVDWRL